MTPEKFETCFKKIEAFVARTDSPVARMREVRTDTPFHVAVATILSPRTTDVILKRVIEDLFRHIRTPEDIVRMPMAKLKKIIKPIGFYNMKAKSLKGFARDVVERFNGRVPDTMQDLLSLPGVGIKVAAIILVEGYGKNAISVDTHVHRIANRMGLVKTRAPEETCKRLYEILPERLWSRINFNLVAFGQTVCRPISPKCTLCPIERMCPKLGVNT